MYMLMFGLFIIRNWQQLIDRLQSSDLIGLAHQFCGQFSQADDLFVAVLSAILNVLLSAFHAAIQ